MPDYNPLDGTATLLYSELLDRSLGAEIAKGVGFSFTSKTLKGRKYWYLQHTLGNSRKQYYLGQDSEDLRASIASQKARWEEDKQDLQSLEKLVAMAINGGCASIPHRAYKVLSAIEQSGLFRAGGVLVGSYAFQALGNMLGVAWEQKLVLTMDVDLAGSNECLVAIPEGIAPLSETILNSDSGMVEVPMLNRKHPSISFRIRGAEFRVDLVTSEKGAPSTSPVHISAIDSYAKPLRFLDFILEDTQKVVLLHKEGVVANVPSPGRFAVHKLVLGERRSASEAAKARKDTAQATQLVACLLDSRPGDLWLALDAAGEYPSAGFMRNLKAGIRKLPVNLRRPIAEYLQ
jgi:hypothetical protein